MNNQRPSIGQGLADLGADRGDFDKAFWRIVIFSTYCLSNIRELAQLKWMIYLDN
jgi:hypothetical protein